MLNPPEFWRRAWEDKLGDGASGQRMWWLVRMSRLAPQNSCHNKGESCIMTIAAVLLLPLYFSFFFTPKAWTLSLVMAQPQEGANRVVLSVTLRNSKRSINLKKKVDIEVMWYVSFDLQWASVLAQLLYIFTYHLYSSDRCGTRSAAWRLR